MSTPVTVKIKFKCETLEQFIERYAVDVSQDGIFVRTPKPLSVGTAVKFEFQLQDGSPLLSGDGTVVWTREKDAEEGAAPGMGVRFDQLPPQSQKVLSQVLEHKARAQEFSDQPTRVASEEQMMQEAGIPPLAVPETAESVSADEEGGSRALDEEEPSPTAKAASSPAVSDEAGEDLDMDSDAEEADSRKGESEDEHRGDRLAKMLFDDEKSGAHKMASTEVEGDESSDEHDGKSQESSSYSSMTSTTKPQKKGSSSGIVIVIILIVLGVGAFAVYKMMAKQEPPPPPPMEQSAVEPTAPETPTAARAKIDSTPQGAKIFLNGEDTGKVTPTELTELEAGKEYAVILELPGKKRVHQTLKTDGEAAIAAALDADSIKLVRLTTNPAGATVTVDGKKLKGETPLELDKPFEPGKKHEVIFKLRGYADQTISIAEDYAWTREGDDKEVMKIEAALEAKAAPAPIAAKPVAPKPATSTAAKTETPAAQADTNEPADIAPKPATSNENQAAPTEPGQ